MFSKGTFTGKNKILEPYTRYFKGALEFRFMYFTMDGRIGDNVLSNKDTAPLITQSSYIFLEIEIRKLLST